MTMKSPALIRPARMASLQSVSLSKTRALPVNWRMPCDTADCLMTAPSGQRLPRRTAMPPSA